MKSQKIKRDMSQSTEYNKLERYGYAYRAPMKSNNYMKPKLKNKTKKIRNIIR